MNFKEDINYIGEFLSDKYNKDFYPVTVEIYKGWRKKPQLIQLDRIHGEFICSGNTFIYL